MVCFSAEARPNEEILMWTHYADMHRGIRIGFDLPEKTPRFILRKVRYRKSRVAVDLSVDGFEPSVQEAVRLSLRTKSKGWAYEREYRLMTNPERCVPGEGPDEGKLFIPFKREWVCRIDFGTRTEKETKAAIRELVRKKYPGVLITQALYHKTDYAMVYEPYR